MRRTRTSIRWISVLVALSLTAFLGVALVAARASQAAIIGWTIMTPLPHAGAGDGVVAHADWLYSLGGWDATSAATNSVLRAPIDAQGNLGAWETLAPLPRPLHSHAVVAVGDRIYVIGGWDGSQRRAEVWRAQIDAAGRPGGWQRDRDFPSAIALHAAAAANGRLYVSGGDSAHGRTNQVYRATVAADGTLGPWQQSADLPPDALYRHAMTATDTTIYVSGGYDGATVQTNLYTARINADGSLAPWQTSAMPIGREYHQAVIHDGRLIVLGGRLDAAHGGLARVDVAALGADGRPMSWSSEAGLPVALFRLSATVQRRGGLDTLYVVGGLSGSQYQSAVYRARTPPPTPTRTPTPTKTPTPTPTTPTGIEASLSSNPAGPFYGGEEITYRIDYTRTGTNVVTNLVITNAIPSGVQLIADSISPADKGSVSGDVITWSIGAVGIQPGAGSVSYRVCVPPATPTPSPTPTPTRTPDPNRCGDISGYVYFDANGNGVRDASETTGYGGVLVTLKRDDVMQGQMNTVASGWYGFSQIALGEYNVSITLPAGYQNTSALSVAVNQADCTPRYKNFGLQPALQAHDAPAAATPSAAATAKSTDPTATPTTVAAPDRSAAPSEALGIPGNAGLPRLIFNRGAYLSWQYNAQRFTLRTNTLLTGPRRYLPLLLK